MATLLYLRKTCDWSTVSVDNLDSSLVNTDKLKVAIRAWNEIASITYFDYRAKLKELSMSQWRLPFITNVKDVSDTDWIIPTDDDDWFAPIINFPSYSMFVHWRSLVCQSSRFLSVFTKGSANQRPESNSYAIRGRLLKMLTKEDRDSVLNKHQKSLKIVNRYYTPTFLSDVMSSYNMHPGCAHILKSCRTTEDVRNLFVGGELPATDTPWFDEIAGKFMGLYRSAYDCRE